MNVPAVFSSEQKVAVLAPFDGWENYPSNVPGFDPLCEDGGVYSDRLEAMQSELFSTEDAIQVIDAHGP